MFCIINDSSKCSEHLHPTSCISQSPLSLIPKLQYGLDVNVQFDNGPQAFEFTEELEAFDTTAVTLRHGWLVDPQDSETYNVMKNLRNYNR